MPEMPEVEGLVRFLRERTTGRRIERARVTAVSALKTYDPPIDVLVGARITTASRHGKFLDIDTDASTHLVFHLAKAGWLRWYEALPTTVLRPGKSPIALRVGLDDGSGFDLTEAGTKKSLSVYVVRDPADVAAIARLGPDPIGADPHGTDPRGPTGGARALTRDDFAALLAGRRTQIKGVLRDQSIIAGVGNAYSDEILHAARMSPYALAASLEGEAIDRLYAALVTTLDEAVAEASGIPPAELKDAKKGRMRVHGRSGQPCPVCGETVRSVYFADNSMQYCPRCQTGGKILADRRLSRLLK